MSKYRYIGFGVRWVQKMRIIKRSVCRLSSVECSTVQTFGSILIKFRIWAFFGLISRRFCQIIDNSQTYPIHYILNKKDLCSVSLSVINHIKKLSLFLIWNQAIDFKFKQRLLIMMTDDNHIRFRTMTFH